MIGTWLLCTKCKIKVNAFNTYNWWLVHGCYTWNACFSFCLILNHLQYFCWATVRIHNFVFQISRFLLDFRISVKFVINNYSIVGILTWPTFPSFKCDPQHRSWLFIWICDLQLVPTHWSVEIITLPKSPTQCAL